jgi:N-acetylmuramoyl-L-alanine amidase
MPEIGLSQENEPLTLVYPSNNHQTSAPQIFFIGNAKGQGQLLINGKNISRSRTGNFAPSFPLQIGENLFTISYQEREIQLKIIRIANTPSLAENGVWAKDSFFPERNIARLPDELICFSTVAIPNIGVKVRLGEREIPLSAIDTQADLPPNNAVLTATNQPTTNKELAKYSGCSSFKTPGKLGNPQFEFSFQDRVITQASTGSVEILDRDSLDTIEVIASPGATRSGPSTDYSRLTPLPQGTRATVTGVEGEWYRLDYGVWIKQAETKLVPGKVPPRAIIKSVTSRQVSGATEIIFPLSTPVPLSVKQGEKNFTLTLYNTIAQTDTIRFNDDPAISLLDWQQVEPGKIDYTFNLKSKFSWGYTLKYEGTSLILSLRHPPRIDRQNPLRGIKILLDPGHGGNELGSRGPTGYPEKDANLFVSQVLQAELKKRGALVFMTRESDRDVSLGDRVKIIDELQPTISISLHYNALPDAGDAINTSGVSAFWFHPQAQDLALFIKNYLVKKLNRPDYGLFWNNLALTRPHSTPAILLELGFTINPTEFEWIANPQEQQKLGIALADALTEWFRNIEP